MKRSQDRFKGNLAVRPLLDHLTLNEEYQSVYKMLHSTETALLRVQHDIASELDKNCAGLFVILDLSSAFDTTDHEHLLTLLHDEYGVRETALLWFRTCLEDRTHCVQIDSKTKLTYSGLYGVYTLVTLFIVLIYLFSYVYFTYLLSYTCFTLILYNVFTYLSSIYLLFLKSSLATIFIYHLLLLFVIHILCVVNI